MKFFSVLLLMTLAVYAVGQVASSCTVPQQLESTYHRDIVRLATNYLFQIQSPDTIYVHPQQQAVDDISGGLAAILNAASIPERDSVFNLYCVHDLNGWPYDYDGYLVGVDTSFTWTQAWQNLITLTGNPFVDSLTTQYALHVTNFYNWSFGNYALLSTDSDWNSPALMDSIGLAPGVVSVEQNGLIGEAGKIEYYKNGSDRFFDFYFEFNDCFDGCDNYHRWSFKVDSNCSVYYLGFLDWGIFGISPLPAPVNCNLFTTVNEVSENEIVVFPNPVSNQLAVSYTQQENGMVSVFNYVGKLVMTSPLQNTIRNGRCELDVQSLKAGLYILEITVGDKTFRSKFCKSEN